KQSVELARRCSLSHPLLLPLLPPPLLRLPLPRLLPPLAPPAPASPAPPAHPAAPPARARCPSSGHSPRAGAGRPGPRCPFRAGPAATLRARGSGAAFAARRG